MNAPVQMTLAFANFVRKSHYKKFMRDWKSDVKRTSFAYMIIQFGKMFERELSVTLSYMMTAINVIQLHVEDVGTVEIHVQELASGDDTMVYLFGVAAHFMKSCVEHEDLSFFSENKIFYVADNQDTAVKMFVDDMQRQAA